MRNDKDIKNIMLAFVSPVNPKSIENPVQYPDLAGQPYEAIQTNESAIVYMQRKLQDNALDRVLLISSDTTRKETVPAGSPIEGVTHLEFLKARLVAEFPALQDKFIECSYPDGIDDLDACILKVAEIAEEIKQYAAENPTAQVVMHADMTGGFRHASMMMLSIMQLLKYSGIEIGEVLYSDMNQKRVYQATSIHRMFDLISGADEFVNYGSVKGIYQYFEELPVENRSKELKELLEAMKYFSDAIHICRTSVIIKELEKMNHKIENYRTAVQKDYENRNLQEKVFFKIMDVIKREYGGLIEHKSRMDTRMDIIQWCMKKDLWQQAITLATEWIPEYIVENRICYTENANVLTECEQEGKKCGEGSAQYFLAKYPDPRVTRADAGAGDSEIGIKAVRDMMREFTMEGLQEAEKKVKHYPSVLALLEECKFGSDAFENLKMGILGMDTFAGRYPMLYKVTRALYAQLQASCTDTYEEFLAKKNLGQLIVSMHTCPKAAMEQVFFPESVESVSYDVSQILEEADTNYYGEKNRSSWKYRKSACLQLFAVGKMKTNTPDLVMSVLKDYHMIRYERNQINHANEEDKISIEAIRKLLTRCFEELAGSKESM